MANLNEQILTTLAKASRGDKAIANQLRLEYERLSAYVRQESMRIAQRYESRIAEMVASGAFSREAAAAHLVATSWQFDQMQKLEQELARRMERLQRKFDPAFDNLVKRSLTGVRDDLQTYMRAYMDKGNVFRVGRTRNPFPMGAWENFNARQFAAIAEAERGAIGQLLTDAYGYPTAVRATNILKQAVGTGLNPMRTAYLMEQEVGIPFRRAATIARTEQLRASRAAQISALDEAAARGAPIIGYVWVSSRNLTTCAACWAMDGTVFKVGSFSDGGFVNDHPNGRCGYEPLFEGENVNDVLGGSAEDAFYTTLTGPQQRAILGPTRYEMWQRGDMTLKDFGHITENGKWGKSVSSPTVRELKGLRAPTGITAPTPDVAITDLDPNAPGAPGRVVAPRDFTYSENMYELQADGLPDAHFVDENKALPRAYQNARDIGNRQKAKAEVVNNLTERIMTTDVEGLEKWVLEEFRRDPSRFLDRVMRSRYNMTRDDILGSPLGVYEHPLYKEFMNLPEAERAAWRTLLDNPEIVRAYIHSRVDYFVAEWASSSASHTSMLVKRRIAKILDIEPEALSGELEEFEANLLASKEGRPTGPWAQAEWEEWFIDNFVRAQYDLTQEWFAARGIKEIKLFRGMAVESKEAEWVGGLATGQNYVTDIPLNVLSSFSFHAPKAWEFGVSGYGVILEGVVPVDRIFSMTRTGFGCLEEFEAVTLPMRGTWRVWRRVITREKDKLFGKFADWWPFA